jgi:hypothetical protein
MLSHPREQQWLLAGHPEAAASGEVNPLNLSAVAFWTLREYSAAMPASSVQFDLFGVTESWSFKEIYCPQCGACSVWQMDDPSVAQGERPVVCVACDCCFFISAICPTLDPSNARRKAEIVEKAKAITKSKPWLIYKRTAGYL